MADGGTFCDGFEIWLGAVSKNVCWKSKGALQNHIQSRIFDLQVKNLLFIERGDHTYLWISFTYESAKLRPGFLYYLTMIMRAVREHSIDYWDYNTDECL